MHTRFYGFAQALRTSGLWARTRSPGSTVRLAQSVCRTCQYKFSTSSILRQIAQATTKNGAKRREQRYPSRLLIYDAGEMRTSWVSFWKATAIFQFTVTAVWAVPVLYKNENQPDPNVRLLQAIGVAVLSAVPMVTMSYLTAPFVATIHLRVPPTAAYTREALISFARNPPPSTLLEFTTLRIFPARKLTTTYLSELRALAPQRGRFANIELPKTKAWHDRQKQKGFWERVFQMMNEPRFKFYVKEGQSYTIRTRVPGVWEGVAGAIQQQTMASEAAAGKGGKVRTTATPGPTRLLEDVKKQKVVKRQTSRLRK